MVTEFKNLSEKLDLYKNGKRTKTSNFTLVQIADFHNMNPLRCFFCTRTEDQLGKNETLEIEHILQIIDHGQDSLENLQILCTACHELKNWNIKHVKKNLVEWITNPVVIKAKQNKINLHDFWEPEESEE